MGEGAVGASAPSPSPLEISENRFKPLQDMSVFSKIRDAHLSAGNGYRSEVFKLWGGRLRGNWRREPRQRT